MKAGEHTALCRYCGKLQETHVKYGSFWLCEPNSADTLAAEAIRQFVPLSPESDGTGESLLERVERARRQVRAVDERGEKVDAVQVSLDVLRFLLERWNTALNYAAEEDYLFMQAIDDSLDDRQLAGVLSRNGAANLTVCPRCRVDDFVHVEGCALLAPQYRCQFCGCARARSEQYCSRCRD